MTNPIKSQIAANRERFDEKFVFWGTRKNLKFQKKMVIQTPEKLKDFLTTSQTSLLQTAIAAVEGMREKDWTTSEDFALSKVVELLKGGIDN